MKSSQRLYPSIRPSHYQLHFIPNLTELRFTLDETLVFETTEDSSSFTFHGHELDIESATINEHTCSVQMNPEDQTVTLFTETPLKAGQHSLSLKLSAALNDKLHGFYRASYQKDGETVWMATTQFESHFARWAFVGIDEPAAKATFEISITAPSDLVALSNTEVIREQKIGDLTRYDYAVTPRMSTYLVAMVIGPLEKIELHSKSGKPVRVYTQPGKTELGQFALEVASQTLDFYEEYFDHPYPLPKVDMVAIPDFAAGAMENWGLITYRENAILIDEANSAPSSRQWVASVVVHELGHQWFGNLVTMDWWTDLWLNEGFASWTEALATNQLFPEWEMWTQFVANDYTEARGLDALANTHAIEVAINHPDEINEIFDAISYSKGASMIRMLEVYLGSNVFRDGLRSYLKKHAYGNAKTADLWAALEESSGKPVSELMSDWTKQAGFPVVSFDRDGNDLKISQQRFLGSSREASTNQDATIWPIPISIATENGVLNRENLVRNSTESWPVALTNTSWFKPNPGQSGFYIVGYSAEQLKSLESVLPSLPVADRFGIVSDTFALIESGKLKTSTGLDLIMSLANDPEYVVWQAILGGLGGVFGILSDDGIRDGIEARLAKFILPKLADLGYVAKPNESYLNGLLRPQVLSLAGRCRNADVLAWAKGAVAKHRSGDLLDPSLRNAAYGVVARNGSTEDYDAFLEAYRKEDLQEERSRLAVAMAGFVQPELTKRFLDWTLSGDVRTQDAPIYFTRSLLNRFNRAQAWQFVQDQWDYIMKQYGGGGHMLTLIPNVIGASMNTTSEAEAVRRFFDSHQTPTIERPIRQAIENIYSAADWFERDKDDLASWVKAV